LPAYSKIISRLENQLIGKGVVLAVFTLSKGNKIAGSRVTEGEVRRNARIRLLRGADIVYEGEIFSLKHEKSDEREIRNGFECGIGLKNFNDIEVGDQMNATFWKKGARLIL
jgi:translation initiation factor IF-2